VVFLYSRSRKQGIVQSIDLVTHNYHSSS